MKFKKGDIVTRNKNKPTASFESVVNYERVEIKNVERLGNVYYYQWVNPNNSYESILLPQSSFDELYDLHLLYNRGLKINRLIKNIDEK